MNNVKTIMVGDRTADIDSLKNAGAAACFFNTNEIAVPDETDFEIENLQDLLRYI